ncbi:MAG: M23 family metallopeptidase [archaeon]
MNRKGQVFIVGLVIIVIIVLIYGYIQMNYNYRIKSELLHEPLGEKQSALIRTYQRAENSLFYIDQAGEYSYYTSLLDMASSGGIYAKQDVNTPAVPKCGEHVYYLWNNDTEECYPDFKSNITGYLDDEMNSRLDQHILDIGWNNYDYTFKQQNASLKLIAKAKQKVNFEIMHQSVMKGFTDVEGTFVFPIALQSDRINTESCFGYRDLDGKSENGKENFHDGIDLAVAKGSEVYAVTGGSVFKICEEWTGTCQCSLSDPRDPCSDPTACRGKCGNYGNYIILKHGENLYTRYSHLDSVARLSEGDVVNKGDVIARSGNTGKSGGPHLDFKVYASDNLGGDKANSPFCFYSEEQLSKFIFTDTAFSCKDKYNYAMIPSRHDPDLAEECTHVDTSLMLSLGADTGGSGSCQMSVLLNGDEPSLSEDEVNRVLGDANSPATNFGHIFYGYSASMGIDNAFALAFFRKESGYGTAGVATRTHSIGNMMIPSNCQFDKPGFDDFASGEHSKKLNTQCTDSTYECDFVDCNPYTFPGKVTCFCGFNDWDKGIMAWFDMIAGPYYVGAGLDTVEKILPKYDPPGAEGYITFVRKEVSQYDKYKNTPPCAQVQSVWGGYTVEPHFSAVAEHDLGVYRKLVEFAKETAEECAGDGVVGCVEDKMKEFNDTQENKDAGFVISRACEDNYLYYDFVEEYYDCLMNNQSACYCKMNFTGDTGETFKIKFIEDKFFLEVPDDNELAYYLPFKTTFYANNPSVDAEEYNDLFYEVEFDEDGKFIKAQILRPLILPPDVPADILYLYKPEKKSLFMIGAPDGTPECAPNKYRYRFCLETPSSVPNPEKGFKPEQIKIRFALEMKDITEPPVIKDLEGTLIDPPGNLIAVKWEPSPAIDLFAYRVYDGTNMFPIGDTYNELIAGDCDTSILRINLRGVVACSGSTCTFTTLGISTSAEIKKCYHLEDEDMMFYIMQMPPKSTSESYYVGVTAIDGNNNEIEVPGGFSYGSNYISLPEVEYPFLP